MKVAFLLQIYPATTHTFIRREIRAVEDAGIEVIRVSVRLSREQDLTTPADVEELHQSVGILGRGLGSMFWDVAHAAWKSPLAFIRTVARACRMGVRSERGLFRHLAYFVESCGLLRTTAARGADHVHAHFGNNATTVAMFTNAMGGPSFSFQIHGPGEFDCPEFIHLSAKVHAARFVTVISQFAKGQTFRNSAPRDWEKVHVIRCGVDEEFLGQPITLVTQEARLVCIGRLGRSKAHPILVRASAKLKAEGLPHQVTVIGEGELMGAIEDLIRELDVVDTVKLVGWKSSSEVRDEILRSRALVLPSFGEVLPVVIMEALALARPVISTKIAGIPELVKDGWNGWLIDSGDVDELVRAMREVLTAPPEDLLKLGTHGREDAKQLHDVAAEGKKLAALFSRYVSEIRTDVESL